MLSSSLRLNFESTMNRLRHAKRAPAATILRLVDHLWFFAKTGRTVASGPFAGMYLPLIWPHLPCLLGTYETELLPVWQEILGIDFRRFVDVGTADGYYAVGLAKTKPSITVEAFELNPAQQKRIARLASANGVQERVRVRGFCDAKALGDALSEAQKIPTLVLMDIEGGEATLLDPRLVPELALVHLLIEVHNGHGPKLRERFVNSHTLAEIRALPRQFSDMPSPGILRFFGWTRQMAVAAMDERKGRIDWLWMVPKPAS